MIHLPEPSAREVRWSFLVAAVTALALTATLCWGIVHRVNQSDDIVHIAASSADTVERLNNQVETLNARLATQAKMASAQNLAHRRENQALRHEIDVLVQFLRSRGLPVPRIALESGGGSSGPKGQGPRGPRPYRPTGKPTPTPSPTPSPGVLDPICNLLGITCPTLP